MEFTQPRTLHASPGAALSKATLRAADLLQVSQSELAAIVGVSPAVVSRVVAGGSFPKTGKSFELATLFIQLFRSLDTIVGGDAAVAATWLRQANAALGGLPIDKLKTVAGLTSTLAYLDARRKLV